MAQAKIHKLVEEGTGKNPDNKWVNRRTNNL